MKLIGWLFVFWLIGSALYSTLFHFSSFRRQRERIESGEAGEIYKRLHQDFNWKFLFGMQIIKIGIALLIIFLFLLK